MNIEKFIQQGKEHKAEYERQLAQEIEHIHEKRRHDHVLAWQPILQKIEKLLPSELAHVLTTPEHSSRTGDSGNRRDASFEIRIPGTQIRIDCNPDTRWQQSDGPTFQAMSPDILWDESGYDGFYIEWRPTGDKREDFLIALSEAAAAADTLPAVQAEADRKNAEWLAQETAEKTAPEPAPQPVDWLEKAKAAITKTQMGRADASQVASSFALIAIAQELRKLSSVVEANNYGGYSLSIWDSTDK